jgi:uncharacterized protein
VIVVSDSTVLIGLAKIGKLSLLRQLFSRINIPEEVRKEIAPKGKAKPGSREIRESKWILAKTVKDQTEVNLLLGSLDKGEAEVLVLAKQLKADLILADEEKARKVAAIAGFNVMGILGILLLAKKTGLLEEIKPSVDELTKKNFRLSDRVIHATLSAAGE